MSSIIDTRAPITRRQRAILDVILNHVYAHGYPPSVREIGQAVGLASTSSVAHQLEVLQARGYIVRAPGGVRALTVVGYTSSEVDQARVEALRTVLGGPVAYDTRVVLQTWLDELTGAADGDEG